MNSAEIRLEAMAKQMNMLMQDIDAVNRRLAIVLQYVDKINLTIQDIKKGMYRIDKSQLPGG